MGRGMNKYYYDQKIKQGAGHDRLSTGHEEIVVFDDGDSYIDIQAELPYRTDYGSFAEQVKGLETYTKGLRRKVERLERIIDECKKRL